MSIDPDHLAERLDHHQVGMRPRDHPALVLEQLARERERRRRLAHTARSVQEVGMRRPIGERRRQQALGLRLLRNRCERLHGSPSAISSASRDASTTTMRSGKRAASAS